MRVRDRGLFQSEDDEQDDDGAVAIRRPGLPGASGGGIEHEIDPLGDSTTGLRLSHNAVVVSIGSGEQRRKVCDALRRLDVTVVSEEWTADALVVIADAAPDVRAQLAALRSAARPDTAIFLAGVTSPSVVGDAHAAGASACLRAPVVVEELVALVSAAVDAHATRGRVADLTEKLDLEAHLASVGRISAGLAHEISSPLFTATMNLDALEESARALVTSVHEMLQASPRELARAQVRVAHDLADLETSGLDESLAGARVAHDRLRAIVAQMRALMQRDEAAELGPVDAAALLPEARALAAADLAGVDVTVVAEPALALTDKSVVVQILQNLIANAAHAAKSLPSPRVRLHCYVSGDSAVVSVRDNGPGIPPELQQRVFEPFFTTRHAAGGTGLGLALCREYAARIGAEISVWSVPGRGACFRVKMPRAR